MKCKVYGKEIKIEGECKYCEGGYSLLSYPSDRKQKDTI